MGNIKTKSGVWQTSKEISGELVSMVNLNSELLLEVFFKFLVNKVC